MKDQRSEMKDSVSQIILASASPRRRELLGALGVEFEVRPSDVNEDPLPGETPLETQQRITRDKARVQIADVRSQMAETPSASGLTSDICTLPISLSPTIIACDTTVLLDGEMLNKPADEAEAWAMLRKLRNRTHEVQSCIVIRQGEVETLDVVTSQVVMRDYSDDEIAAYIATGDPFDKAGSYAVQHEQFHPVAEIRGCPLNVIGLALCRLGAHLPALPDSTPACMAYVGRTCAQNLTRE